MGRMVSFHRQFLYLIEKIGEGFHSNELAGHIRKLDPNESGSLDRFAFLRQYVDKEVFLESAEEAESFLGQACKVRLMDLQRKIFLNIHAPKRERKQERLSLKQGSSFQPLRKGGSPISQLQQSIESKTGTYIHPLKSIKKWRVN